MYLASWEIAKCAETCAKRAQICAKLIKIAHTNANFKKVSLRNGVQACPSIIPKTVLFFNSVLRSSEMLLVHAPKHLRLRKWLFILLVIRCWDGGHLINSQVNKTNWFAINVFFRNILILLAWALYPKFAPFLRTFLSCRNLGINGRTRFIYNIYIYLHGFPHSAH